MNTDLNNPHEQEDITCWNCGQETDEFICTNCGTNNEEVDPYADAHEYEPNN